jgi:hypothetical protein
MPDTYDRPEGVNKLQNRVPRKFQQFMSRGGK